MEVEVEEKFEVEDAENDGQVFMYKNKAPQVGVNNLPTGPGSQARHIYKPSGAKPPIRE